MENFGTGVEPKGVVPAECTRNQAPSWALRGVVQSVKTSIPVSVGTFLLETARRKFGSLSTFDARNSATLCPILPNSQLCIPLPASTMCVNAQMPSTFPLAIFPFSGASQATEFSKTLSPSNPPVEQSSVALRTSEDSLGLTDFLQRWPIGLMFHTAHSGGLVQSVKTSIPCRSEFPAGNGEEEIWLASARLTLRNSATLCPILAQTRSSASHCQPLPVCECTDA
ncbi:hypothetical protein CRENBAI_003869 [Crenichthys baileyi]|uniref:Uncharacterized protein n=1 Tax=Crenichthys baileyi TaxID=28760 RepID=A0AAV9STK3_9TELE